MSLHDLMIAASDLRTEILPEGWSAPAEIGDRSWSSSKFFAADGCYRTAVSPPGSRLLPECQAIDAEYAKRAAAATAAASLKAQVDAALANVNAVIAGTATPAQRASN